MSDIKIPEGERDLREVVWENLEKYRKIKGISQLELCKLVKYDHMQYSRNKKKPVSINYPVLQRFAFYLEINTIDLFEDWLEE